MFWCALGLRHLKFNQTHLARHDWTTSQCRSHLDLYYPGFPSPLCIETTRLVSRDTTILVRLVYLFVYYYQHFFFLLFVQMVDEPPMFNICRCINIAAK
ncbi:uncharacterized protein BDW47DRAFT_107371 [Aspergillus candidus]|uniref:Uncharacterized protein n=1 Tax=Aspergillus candidus TaxID=41067 RepID=A0A2I2F8Y6_ASPCN|nr:hypothetical protein BDW47DRAFT_107371 [Aspergillus candidus]PLB37090.1 hypothetical protein BDW47DRAFT_107371 [Aspergillus candidus]